MWDFLEKLVKKVKAAATAAGSDSIGLVANFTPRAQQVFALSRLEARRLNHKVVGTEHLLLGLLKLGQGVAVNVLQTIGVNLETVRLQIEKETKTHSDQEIIGNANCTRGVKKVLVFASEEANALHHRYVGTEHILLGLLREGGGLAAKVIKNLGVDSAQMRQAILRELDLNCGTAAS